MSSFSPLQDSTISSAIKIYQPSNIYSTLFYSKLATTEEVHKWMGVDKVICKRRNTTFDLFKKQVVNVDNKYYLKHTCAEFEFYFKGFYVPVEYINVPLDALSFGQILFIDSNRLRLTISNPQFMLYALQHLNTSNIQIQFIIDKLLDSITHLADVDAKVLFTLKKAIQGKFIISGNRQKLKKFLFPFLETRFQDIDLILSKLNKEIEIDPNSWIDLNFGQPLTQNEFNDMLEFIQNQKLTVAKSLMINKTLLGDLKSTYVMSGRSALIHGSFDKI